jgi:hypothetical protein
VSTWQNVTPKYRFLPWTGTNLDEWQARWGDNVWLTEEGLFYGPSLGPVQIGGGMVEQAGTGSTFTPAGVASSWTVISA